MSRDPTTETKHQPICLNSDWLEAFRDRAEAKGLPLSTWLTDLGMADLPPKVAAKLSPRRKRGPIPKE